MPFIKKQIYSSESSLQTKKIGKDLAGKILKSSLQNVAFVIGLKGDLGSGKTTFLQGFARGLKIKEKILSPTFVVLKKFKISNSRFKYFYHLDCYRIQKPREILSLDFKEIIFNQHNIVAIEWPERILKFLPPNAMILKFQFIDQNKRKIFLCP